MTFGGLLEILGLLRHVVHIDIDLATRCRDSGGAVTC